MASGPAARPYCGRWTPKRTAVACRVVSGIVSYGTYVPYWRLDRQRIAEALLTPAGRGTRAVASYDEDTTTMGVEAARVALAAAPEGLRPHALYLATSAPAYADKTNATAIPAAL